MRGAAEGRPAGRVAGTVASPSSAAVPPALVMGLGQSLLTAQLIFVTVIESYFIC